MSAVADRLNRAWMAAMRYHESDPLLSRNRAPIQTIAPLMYAETIAILAEHSIEPNEAQSRTLLWLAAGERHILAHVVELIVGQE